MSKTDKELAVELVLAQIQASSIIKADNLHTGHVLKGETVVNLLNAYHSTLKSLGDK